MQVKVLIGNYDASFLGGSSIRIGAIVEGNPGVSGMFSVVRPFPTTLPNNLLRDAFPDEVGRYRKGQTLKQPQAKASTAYQPDNPTNPRQPQPIVKIKSRYLVKKPIEMLDSKDNSRLKLDMGDVVDCSCFSSDGKTKYMYQKWHIPDDGYLEEIVGERNSRIVMAAPMDGSTYNNDGAASPTAINLTEKTGKATKLVVGGVGGAAAGLAVSWLWGKNKMACVLTGAAIGLLAGYYMHRNGINMPFIGSKKKRERKAAK